MSKRRLDDRKRRHDRYFKRARQESFAARSVYKLQELDRRFRLFRSGMSVLDLGAYPGSWLQYIEQQIGTSGRTIGVDRRNLEISLAPTTSIVVGDVHELTIADIRSDIDFFDIVVSDMAPDTSGIHFADQAKSLNLYERALHIALATGGSGSHFIAKILMGPGIDDLLVAAKKSYKRVRLARPDATRKESTEFYLVAIHKRSAAAISV